MESHDESQFVKHIPCESCGSSDANALYDDGHEYCHICKAYKAADGETSAPKSTAGVSFLVPQVRALTARRLSEETCRRFGYGTAQGHSGAMLQVAQYYDSKGTLVAQKLRSRNKDFAVVGKLKAAGLFGQQIWRDNGKRLVITEGEIDCMVIAQCFNLKWPVVSLKNGASGAAKDLAAQVEWISGFEEIVLAFDNDEPGQKAVEAAMTVLPVGKVKVVAFPNGIKDADELNKEKGSQAVCTAIFEAQQRRPDGVFEASELKDRWKQRAADVPSYELPYPHLNEYLRGSQQGRLYMVTAGSGIGKSTVVHQIGHHLVMTQGARLGILALEETVEETLDRYVGLELQKPIAYKPESASEEDKDAAFDRVTAGGKLHIYDHFGSQETGVILSRIRYLACACQCDTIILDHISIVVSGMEQDAIGDERKAIDVLMTKLRSLAGELHCTIWAIVHLKRPKDGRSYNEGRQVSLSDLRGSGSLEQLSDAVIAVERDQQGPNPEDLTTRVLKNRWGRVTGPADLLVYDLETGLLVPSGKAGEDHGFKDETKEADF